MITPDQERWILSKAYVPEHIVSLMTTISKGQPFLSNGHLYYVGDTWGILVGYPLDSEFYTEIFSSIFKDVTTCYPGHTWSIIAPCLPSEILSSGVEKQSDFYYSLSFEDFDRKEGLKQIAEKATSRLTVEAMITFREKKLKMIWEMSKDGCTSFLVGTAHYLPYSFRESLIDLSSKADVTLFEGLLDENNMEGVREYGVARQDGMSLYDSLDEKTIAELNKELGGSSEFSECSLSSYISVFKREHRDPVFFRRMRPLRGCRQRCSIPGHYTYTGYCKDA